MENVSFFCDYVLFSEFICVYSDAYRFGSNGLMSSIWKIQDFSLSKRLRRTQINNSRCLDHIAHKLPVKIWTKSETITALNVYDFIWNCRHIFIHIRATIPIHMIHLTLIWIRYHSFFCLILIYSLAKVIFTFRIKFNDY